MTTFGRIATTVSSAVKASSGCAEEEQDSPPAAWNAAAEEGDEIRGSAVTTASLLSLDPVLSIGPASHQCDLKLSGLITFTRGEDHQLMPDREQQP